MSKFTPGPWKITDSNRHGDIYIGSEESDHFIIVEPEPFTEGDTEANARLIAAAPELLEACTKAHDALLALHVCDQDRAFADETRTLLHDAIRKATS